MKKFSSLVLSAILVLSVSSSAFAAPKNDDVAKSFAKGKFGLQKELKVKKDKVDELGLRHVRMTQEVAGIPVYGSDYIVSMDKGGKVYYSTGKLDKAAEKFQKTGEFIPAEQAIEIAKADVNYDANNMGAEEDTFSQELYLYNVDGNYVPVYLVSVNFLYPEPGAWKVFVNAYDGQVVDKYNNIQYADVVGSGTGVLGDTKTLNVYQHTDGKYYLIDYTKQNQYIAVYDAKNGTSLPGSNMYDTDKYFTATNHRAGVDAHYYIGKIYDYYYNNFGRNSIDGNGMGIKATVHYSRNYVNAFWNGTQIVFGDGDGVQSLALSGAMDIIAHEIQHGVTSYTADLTYQNQSGSLNEAFSDIFACLCESWLYGSSANWKVGEDVWTPGTSGDALRDLSNPNVNGDPDHMNEYINTTQDYGGVHLNATIVGHGGYEIWTRIGTEKTGKIFYRALTTYLTSSSNYSNCRAACLQAAKDLYGSGSTEYNAVAAGFNDIGVY